MLLHGPQALLCGSICLSWLKRPSTARGKFWTSFKKHLNGFLRLLRVYTTPKKKKKSCSSQYGCFLTQALHSMPIFLLLQSPSSTRLCVVSLHLLLAIHSFNFSETAPFVRQSRKSSFGHEHPEALDWCLGNPSKHRRARRKSDKDDPHVVLYLHMLSFIKALRS